MQKLKIAQKVLTKISQEQLEGKNISEISEALGYKHSYGHELVSILYSQKLVHLAPLFHEGHEKYVYLTPSGKELAEKLLDFEKLKGVDPDLILNVYDMETGMPLPAKVEVGLRGQPEPTLMQVCEDGVLLLEGLSEGEYWIRVSSRGYRMCVGEVSLMSDASFNMALEKCTLSDFLRPILGAIALTAIGVGAVVACELSKEK